MVSLVALGPGHTLPGAERHLPSYISIRGPVSFLWVPIASTFSLGVISAWVANVPGLVWSDLLIEFSFAWIGDQHRRLLVMFGRDLWPTDYLLSKMQSWPP